MHNCKHFLRTISIPHFLFQTNQAFVLCLDDEDDVESHIPDANFLVLWMIYHAIWFCLYETNKIYKIIKLNKQLSPEAWWNIYCVTFRITLKATISPSDRFFALYTCPKDPSPTCFKTSYFSIILLNIRAYMRVCVYIRILTTGYTNMTRQINSFLNKKYSI